MLKAFAVFCLLAGFSLPAWAIAVGDTCTTAGQTATSANSAGTMDILYCNGTKWILASIQFTSPGACNNNRLSALRYTGGVLSVCDGSAYQTIVKAGTTAAGTAPTGTVGYFVMSSAPHDGNFGGLSGANTFCRNDLSANSWLGKPGTLDTSKVFAWMCDQTSCNTITANKGYYYAVSGQPTVGGAFFTSNGSSQGPNDSYTWAASNRFGASYYYWNGRSYCQSPTVWGDCPGDSNSTCSSWTSNSNSVYAFIGVAGTTDGGRFLGSQDACNILYRTICYVNP